jgi:glucokinase
VIAQYADAGTCPMCAQTLEIFVNCLGAEASNMALKSMATGGVFLGGGIPVKLLKRIQSPAFIQAFNDKGRLSSIMENTPVFVILNDHTALFGAAYYALDQTTSH